MSCDVKLLVVRLMCISMYWLHNTVIRRYRSRGKMIPNIIFILLVNLRMDSPANILFASKEQLDYLDNKLSPVRRKRKGTNLVDNNPGYQVHI